MCAVLPFSNLADTLPSYVPCQHCANGVTCSSTYLVSEVCCLDDITKNANLDNPSKQLDHYEKLTCVSVETPRRRYIDGTSRGFLKVASSNGASMMKLPLSVTTGPAFARAMRRVAFGEPSFVYRLRRTVVYANGETSIGTPEVYLGMRKQKFSWGLGLQNSHWCPRRQSFFGCRRRR